MKKRNNRKNEGITLIALVITIIVLLILAGVSIATLTGENGILTRASEAEEKTEEASEEEQRKMAMLEAATNTKSTTFEGITIPAGFAPTRIEGESTVNEGLVITDSKGNEFVWVPVDSTGDNYARNKNYEDYNTSQNTDDDKDYLPDDLKSKAEGEKKEVDIERETVLNAKGFYVSRYEAGKEGTGEPYTLVSKKGATVWNNIAQEKCKEEAKKFINNSEVKSGLITGIQWDLIMEFVNQKKDGNGNTFEVQTFNNDRHAEIPATSGQNNADKVCNIYDLEGNCFEYVAEKHTRESLGTFTRRGGCNGTGDTSFMPAARRNANLGVEGDDKSFRVVLYVMN